MRNIVPLILFLFIQALYSQEKEYTIFSTSINSKYAEFGVTYTNNNKVLFASSKKIEKDNSFTKDRRLNNRQLYLELYSGFVNEKGDIIHTNRFTDETKNKFFESDITFSPDLKTVFFTWNNFYNTQKRIDSAKWQTLRIVKASFNENFKIINTTQLPFNSIEYSIRNPELSKDGMQLYFISDMPNGFGDTDIYIVDIHDDGTYSEPRNLGPNVNTKKAEMFPFIDENNTLYFSSYGHKGKGGLDIFKSEFKDGEFQKAKNLPKPINSKFDDFAFVVKNITNSGFITSTREGGKGGADIYAFKFKDKKIACKQTVTGLIYNKVSRKQLDDVQVTIYNKNKIIASQTTKNGGIFQVDFKCNETYKIIARKDNFEDVETEIITDSINNADISYKIDLTPIKCTQLIAGIVLNKETNKSIDNAKVSLFHNNILKETQTIHKGAAYNFQLQCNQVYKIVIESNNFNSSEIVVKTDNKRDVEIAKTHWLTSIKCNQLITGVVLDRETNKPLPRAIVKIYKNNELVDSLKINSRASFEYEIDCNSKYYIVASHKNYQNNTTLISTSNVPDEKFSKKIFLKSKNEFVTVRNIKMVKINPIYFDLDKSDISDGIAIKLNKVIEILKKYPTIKIEIESHTDSRAPDNYNMELSVERAKSIVDYIISKGVVSSRVSGRGFGETKLLNKCANSVKCTDAEHQLNRRTEFIVIDN